MTQAEDRRGKRVGWLLGAEQRAVLLRRFPPRYAQVVAEHVTLPVRRSAEPAPLPAPTLAELVGRVDDGAGVEAMVVAIAGSTQRVDGGTWHITWSLAAGREAKESNDALAAHGWTAVPSVSVDLLPGRW